MLHMTAVFHPMRMAALLALCVGFSLIYLFACDDVTDFGGISALQDNIRDSIETLFTARVADRATESFVNAQEEDRPTRLQEIAQDIAQDVVQDIQVQQRIDGGKNGVVERLSWRRWLDMMYFSISNTITMGYGDIYPISVKSKLIVIAQMIGLFIVLCTV